MSHTIHATRPSLADGQRPWALAASTDRAHAASAGQGEHASSPVAASDRLRALEQREAQLELRVARCRAALRAGEQPNPSLGRELDGTRSLLAQVHAELATLRRRAGHAKRRETR
ncbi:MAG: hypothetical protein Q8O56_02220 [Solirubrobacteraceae bacterium]|nr:hypothetical protein [Solirubrobacteraceae bacterium]